MQAYQLPSGSSFVKFPPPTFVEADCVAAAPAAELSPLVEADTVALMLVARVELEDCTCPDLHSPTYQLCICPRDCPLQTPLHKSTALLYHCVRYAD